MPAATFDNSTFAGGISWLYAMQEQGGARTAGDVSGAPGRPALVASRSTDLGEMAMGAAGIMPEGVAVQFSPASETDDLGVTRVGGYTLGSSAVRAYLGGEWTVFAMFAWSGGASSLRLVQLGSAGPSLRVTATSTGVTARLASQSGATRSATATLDTTRNTPIMVVVTLSGTTLRVCAADVTGTGYADRGLVGTVDGLSVGDDTITAAHQVAWVGYADVAWSADYAADFAAMASGGAERSDERVARICRWVGVDRDLVAEVGLSQVAYSNAGGASALDLIRAVEGTEDGVFFAAPDGRLRWHARDHRYAPPVRLALTAEQVGVDTTVQVDLARVVNDLTVTGPSGATGRARDQGSVSAFGERTATVQMLAASDDQVESAAWWRVNRYSQPSPRIPSVRVNLLPMSAVQAAAVLSLEIGDRIQVTGMPSTTPGGATVDLMVEGVDEVVSAVEWSVLLATSPYFDAPAAEFDVAEFDADVFVY